MCKVITISGKAEAGKDATASLLEQLLVPKGKKVLIFHYADYLKFICQKYFGWDGMKDEKGRAILQKVGTNIVRERYPDFWVEIASLFIDVFSQDFDFIIIPDCRFPNEVEFMREYDSIHLKVVRLNHENKLTPEQRLHPSETALDDFEFDYVLESESGLGNLYGAVLAFVEFYNLDERR